MYTFVLQPQNIDQQALDLCLERGMFRIGQNMVGCRFVFLNETLRSAVWLRLPLGGYDNQRSLRRLLKKNDGLFTVKVNKLKIDHARQQLYSRYCTVAPGARPANLEAVLDIQDGANFYDSFELTVWDGDRLIAFSYFDVGSRSVQSLLGVYDPEYRKYSLGIYTMLCEIRHGQRLNLSYYYPGYVLPGEPTMDYKLRLRPLEFWNEDDACWQSMETLEHSWLPTTRLDEALEEAQNAIEKAGIQVSREMNPLFEVSAYQSRLRAALPHPSYLRCESAIPNLCFVIVRNLYGNHWELWECRPVEAKARSKEPHSTQSVELLLRRSKRAHSSDIQTLLTALIVADPLKVTS